MKTSFAIAVAAMALAGCTKAPQQNEPLGLKPGMTVAEVQKTITFTEISDAFEGHKLYAKAAEVKADRAKASEEYQLDFQDNELESVTAYYSGMDNVQRAEAYLNEVMACNKVSEVDETGYRYYHCHPYGQGDDAVFNASFSTQPADKATIFYVFRSP